jgi:hypothetical protein
MQFPFARGEPIPCLAPAGNLIANFLSSPSCQAMHLSPSIQTESRPATLVMVVTDF